MGEWQQQTKLGFDVETVLAQLSQNQKIALLSGKLTPMSIHIISFY